MKVAVVSPVFNTATGTHPGPIDMFNVIKQRPISQEEKDKCNSLDLCCYYAKPEHIAIDYRNPVLLATKKLAANALTDNSMALVLYKPLPVEEKETSLG